MSLNEITETRQYLTFRLGNEIFAIDVAKVREVLDQSAAVVRAEVGLDKGKCRPETPVSQREDPQP